MREKIIRINAWFSLIFFAILSVFSILILTIEEFHISQLVALILFLVMTITGFTARNIGLKEFIMYKYSVLFAILSFLGAVFFVIVVPHLLIYLIGFPNSFSAIISSIIMFLPIFISSVSILLFKMKWNIKN